MTAVGEAPVARPKKKGRPVLQGVRNIVWVASRLPLFAMPLLGELADQKSNSDFLHMNQTPLSGFQG